MKKKKKGPKGRNELLREQLAKSVARRDIDVITARAMQKFGLSFSFRG